MLTCADEERAGQIKVPLHHSHEARDKSHHFDWSLKGIVGEVGKHKDRRGVDSPPCGDLISHFFFSLAHRSARGRGKELMSPIRVRKAASQLLILIKR